MNRFVGLLVFFPTFVMAQSFAPAPGMIGSTAIYKDSSVIVAWANGVSIIRGPMNIQNQGLGSAAFGVESDAIGPADGLPVSFGDGGEALVTFPNGIANGAGPDFAVFENGFADHYMEFAHVEVSSDGANFFRFESVSETPTDVQLGNGSFSNCAYIHNLAGKYRQHFGTPFDLEELSGNPLLNIDAITHLRLIDVVGSIDPNYGTTDSQGNLINDPFPTPFESGGFDLDAVAVLHEPVNSGLPDESFVLECYPQPMETVLNLSLLKEGDVSIYNAQGTRVLNAGRNTEFVIDVTQLSAGIYLLCIETEEEILLRKVSKH